MGRSTFAVAVLAFVPVGAFAQVTPQDYAFVQSATQVDLVTIQEGQNAVASASNPAVKGFAQDMIQSHTAENQSLAAMVNPPAKPMLSTKSPCLTWQAQLLQQGQWTPFDAAYLQATVYNHQRLVDVLQGEIQAGTDPNMKDYAQKRLPVIQGHLQEAQRLQNGAVAVAVTTVSAARVNFPSGGYQISAEGQRMLADYAHKAAGAQQGSIMATGYTDNERIGPELAQQGITTNEILSQKRADAVKQYLVSQGVRPDMVQVRGMGAADPVASNDTLAGRQQNRRVELSPVSAMSSSVAPTGSGQIAGVTACRSG
jgi:outer membrane protein OmpA-like peptidoglycan-associated protein